MNMKDSAYTKRAAGLLTEGISRLGAKPMRIMEVCGTHTMSIFKAGIRRILPETIDLVSGPGCPVCVTANDYLDAAVAYARLPESIIATFGDMLKIPGSHSSLLAEKTAGADIRVVYSPMDALALAAENSGKQVIFLAVGFETTAPLVAATILAAKKGGVSNLYFLTAHKLVPPALAALLKNPLQSKKIDGFLLPGHVCAITGTKAFEFLSEEFKIPAVVTGFEPLDILEGIYLLVKEIAAQECRLLNQYSRVVKENGNKDACRMMAEVFRPAPSNWRGLGVICHSGLVLKEEYGDFDALSSLPVELFASVEPAGCRCGDVLTGSIRPPECPLFGNKCLPEHPVGSCMVSTEGACAAWYKYQAGRWQF